METDLRIIDRFIKNHTSEAVAVVEGKDELEIAELLQTLPVELSALLVSQMDRFKAARSLEKVDLGVAIQLIEKLTVPVADLLLRQIDQSLCDSLLEGLPSQTSQSLRRILKYPKNTVGAYIDPIVFTLPEDITIGEGLDRLKKSHPGIFPHVYILGRDQSLTGMIELKNLIIHDKGKIIRTVMRHDPPKILADMDISALLNGRIWDDALGQMAVVDTQGIFLGVITREILGRIKPKESSYNIQAMQASNALGDLYQIGLSSLLRTASDESWKTKSKTN